MRTRKPGIPTLTAALAVLAFALATPASALNILALEDPATTPRVGDTFELTLSADFDDTTLGGGAVLEFDPSVVSLDAVTFDGGIGDDPDFRCPTDPDATSPVPCPPTASFVSFGSFSGISGEGSVATLSMSASGVGTTAVGLREESPFGSTTGSELDVSLEGTTVNVVPEPGTAALLGLGLVALGGRSARSRA